MAKLRNKFDRSRMIGYVVTLISLFTLIIPAMGFSISGEVGHTGGYVDSGTFPNITDILLTRDDAEARTWETAMSIFQRLKTSTCGTEAAGRLFGTCKNIGNTTSDDTEHAYELERVKMLYAVRMAVCETGAGGTNAPPPCREAISFSSSLDDEKTYVKHDLRTSQSLKSCIGSLQKKHSTWTSYSNNLQDATALCDAPRQDVEGRRMVSMYRDMLQGVFGISELLKEQMAATGKWFGQAELRAMELEIAHSQILDNLTSQHEEHTARIMQDFEAMQNHANIASGVVDRIGADLERLVSGVHKNASSFGSDLITMRNNLVAMYTNAYTDMALSMNKQISQVDNSRAAISDIVNEHSELMLNLREDIIFVREMWQSYSTQIFADQTMQIEIAQELRNISVETAKHQYEARDGALFVSRHLQDMTDQMTEIEQAFGVVITMYEAYNHGYLRAAMIELVALAFVFFSVGLSLLIPKLWYCGKIVVFLYGWIQASRALFGYLNISRRMTEVIFITHQLLKRSPLIAATIIVVSILICIIAALRFELGIVTKRSTFRTKEREGRIVQFDQQLKSLGGRVDPEAMPYGVRAFSSPPCL